MRSNDVLERIFSADQLVLTSPVAGAAGASTLTSPVAGVAGAGAWTSSLSRIIP